MSTCSPFAALSRAPALAEGPLSKVVGSCSGHGTCVAGMCVCDEGWTGASDVFNTEGLDCQVHTLGLRLLWAAAVLAAAVLWASSLPRVIARVKQVMAAQARRRAKKLPARIPLRDPAMLSIVSFHAICLPWSVVYMLLKIVRPEDRLGSDFGASLCFFVGHIGFFVTVFWVQPFLLVSLLSTSRRLKTLIPITFGFSVYNLVVASLAAALPLVQHARGSSGAGDMAHTTFLVYSGGNALAYFSYALQAAYIVMRVNKLLGSENAVNQATRYQTLRKAITSLERQAVIFALLLCAVYTVFALAPFLHNKLDYLVPVVYVMATAEWKHIALTLAPRVQRVTVVDLAEPPYEIDALGAAGTPRAKTGRQVRKQGLHDDAKKPSVGGEDTEMQTLHDDEDDSLENLDTAADRASKRSVASSIDPTTWRKKLSAFGIEDPAARSRVSTTGGDFDELAVYSEADDDDDDGAV